jgi:integrase
MDDAIFSVVQIQFRVVQMPVAQKLTKRIVESIEPAAGDRLIWDADLKGFGVRVTPAGVRAYVVQYRTAGRRSRRMTIGRHGVITVDEARAKARRILVAVAGGADPMADRVADREAPTVNDLLDRHLADHVRPRCAASTLKLASNQFDRFARPVLGGLKVNSVSRPDIIKLHTSMVGTPRQANLLLANLSKAFANAELWGLRPEGSNPCRKIEGYPENHRERFLSPAELGRLGAALREAETDGLPWPDDGKPKSKHLAKPENRRTAIAPGPLAIIRTLLFTGARLTEICELQWQHVDFERGTLKLPGKKGGERRAHPVSAISLELLASIPRVDGSPWVFPRPADPSRRITKEVLENAWQRVRERAQIEDVRIHDLRHTVGTMASHTGMNAFALRDLLRHASTAMTHRYVNFDHDPVRAGANAVASTINAALEGGEGAEVVPFKRR